MDGGAEGGSGKRRRSRRPPRNLLPFQRRMVEELLEEDGICVMASGMGLPAVAGALLRLQVLRRRTPGQRGAAFVIGAAEWQRDLLMEELAELDEDEEGDEGDGDGEGGGGDGSAGAAADAFAALRRGRGGRQNRNRIHGPAAAVVTAETPAASRASLYATAGVVFISTRILVVDFLTGRVGGAGGTTVNNQTTTTTTQPPPQPAELAGLLVLNAHRSTPNSADAFAAALVRAAAPGAWLRALSDAPPAFLGGFARAERVLGALRLRRLRLWPRFEATVKEALRVSEGGGEEEVGGGDERGEASDGERSFQAASPPRPVQVVELAVTPTPEMASAYEAIADLMDACLRELRRCPALASAANCGELLTLEGAGVLPSSDAAIAGALEAAGARGGGPGGAGGGASGARARGAAADLRTLRALADALLRLDAVSFLRRLETLRAVDTSSGSLSGGIGGGGGWLLHDAAHALFSAAKRRVFVLVRGRGGGGGEEGEGLATAAAAAAAAARGGGKRLRAGGGDRGSSAAAAAAAASAPSSSSSAASVVPVLEPLPKWSLVLDILAEIQAERERLLSSSGRGGGSSGNGDEETLARVAAAEALVLVVSRDARTAAQLRACVAAGGTEPVMRALYAEYLASRLRAAAAGRGRSHGGGSGGRGRGRGRGRGGRGRDRGQASSSAASHPAERLGAVRAARLRGSGAEEAALLQEAKKKKSGGEGDAEGEGAPAAPAPAAPAPAATAPAAPAAPALIFDDGDGDGDGDEEGLGAALASSHPLLQGVAFACLDDHSAVGALLRSCRPSFLVICDPDVSFVRTVELYAASLEHEAFGGGGGGGGGGRSEGGAAAPAPAAAPRGEPARPRRPLRVYHLRYEHSLESDAYAARLTRERRAFEQLIAAKAHMSLPDHAAEAEALGAAAAALRDPHSGAGLLSLSPPLGTREPSSLASNPASAAAAALGAVARPSDAANELTRLGGGGVARSRARAAAAARLRVVVDVREFMSSAALPAALHARGLTLAPCTLEVGDYVLSPALCVERKAIPDLRQSLSSGRLFVQARAMVKHYAVAALLIEFDGDRPFTLGGGAATEGGGAGAGGGGGAGNAAASSAAVATTPFDSGAHSLPARLAILALQFPRLRFLWARSPHAAADLFVALKAGAAREPEADVAAAVGNDEASLALEGGGGAAGGARSVSVAESRSENAPAVDLLRKMPGVTDSNWRRLADAAGSLAGLAKLSEEELARIMSGGDQGESGVVARNAARRLRSFLQTPCPSL